MTNLKAIVENSLNGISRRLTNYTKFLQEVSEDEDGNKFYQDIKLKEFESRKRTVDESFSEMVAKIGHSVEERFSDLRGNPI